MADQTPSSVEELLRELEQALKSRWPEMRPYAWEGHDLAFRLRFTKKVPGFTIEGQIFQLKLTDDIRDAEAKEVLLDLLESLGIEYQLYNNLGMDHPYRLRVTYSPRPLLPFIFSGKTRSEAVARAVLAVLSQGEGTR